MKKRTGNQIRQLFLDFFESKGHKIEPSQSLIPIEDPTLLWINSGVATLKKYFDGSIIPENPKLVNAQKSIRTNDIENVGKTSRHHTFFEMLGNFSIGDYFKKEAIDYAWEFLTDEKWIGFDKDKLFVSVHDEDEEAYNYWVDKIKIDPSHMLKTSDNFWEIGEGPCGPNSEIFYDRGEGFDPDGIGLDLFYKELENDRYVEIWNLVFSQYNSKEGVDRKDYQELPKRNIDTGMGLERLISIIQNGETNFDTDFFLPLINRIEELASVTYQENQLAFRVIADHIRTVTFALADGALFDNAGRGYVLRRILRRAVRYSKQIGIDGSILYTLVPIVSDIMKEFYNYLPEKVQYVSDLVRREEEAFHKTLAHGEKLLNSLIEKNINGIIAGEDVFKLYDTHGFPFELTLEIAEESNLKVDESGFKKALAAQQKRSQSSRDDLESMASQKPDLMAFIEESIFDYSLDKKSAKVIGLFKDGKKVEILKEAGEIILDQTTFYAEMGGQAADSGEMFNDTTKLTVNNVLKAPNGQHLHFIKINQGFLKIGDVLELELNLKKRLDIMANHSATHLLQRALKDVVGEHLAQAGSYVDENRLRFDFTHFEKVTKQQLDEVERIVNQQIFNGIDTNIDYMSIEEAREKGALALFSEKYGNEVRVVDIGGYSIELCGGCHVTNTSAIGLIKIVSEESVGSGVRRIEAVSGQVAYQMLKSNEVVLEEVATIIQSVNVNSVLEKATGTIQELNELKKVNKQLVEKINTLKAKESLNSIEVINNIQLLITESKNQEQPACKQLVFNYRDQLKSGIVILINQNEDNLSYYVTITKDVVEQGVLAGQIVKAINEVCQGRGGGKADFAQGGSKDLINKEVVFTTIKDILESL